MPDAIIVINSGSTSVKFAVYRAQPGDRLPLICEGQIEAMHQAAHFSIRDARGNELGSHDWSQAVGIDHAAALHFIISWLEGNMAGLKVMAAGHRILLGGARFNGPTLITAEVLDALDSLSAMEPSHQAFNVSGARALAVAFAGLIQVACFDNAFHLTMPDVAQTYALPRDVRDTGVRHWGYHGISFEYVAGEIENKVPDARRVIMAHLGGGSSLCALMDGISIDTSMGFGCLAGLPMATRSGDVPADALFFLLRSKRFDPVSLEKMLYESSGLLGLSGISEDMKVLQASDDPRAIRAVEHFVYSLTKYTGAYTAILGGLDALVFTGGIGEHSAPVRAALCDRLGWLGVKLDVSANADNATCISTPDSLVSVWVIPTDEDLMIARHTWKLVQARPLQGHRAKAVNHG